MKTSLEPKTQQFDFVQWAFIKTRNKLNFLCCSWINEIERWASKMLSMQFGLELSSSSLLWPRRCENNSCEIKLIQIKLLKLLEGFKLLIGASLTKLKKAFFCFHQNHFLNQISQNSISWKLNFYSSQKSSLSCLVNFKASNSSKLSRQKLHRQIKTNEINQQNFPCFLGVLSSSLEMWSHSIFQRRRSSQKCTSLISFSPPIYNYDLFIFFPPFVSFINILLRL